ncbi:hypothetical protein B0G85_0802 [Polynucleobacter brandtiae]|uniref:Ion channel n=2 Tax=Polynucleobacter brandtiae TaxID=1938816 RepID=A0A2M8VZY2_9BURK|nr:hypothetical protein B0G85_0802 [Polynucleobacter brandtiae]
MENLSTQFFSFALFRELLIGLVGLGIITIFHSSILMRICVRFDIREEVLTNAKNYDGIFLNFYFASSQVALLHIAEIFIWAVGLFGFGLVGKFIDALLFSGSCYTTVGFIADILPDGWKVLPFMISFSGLFTIAWTTSGMVGMLSACKKAWKLKHTDVVENYKKHW